MPAKGKKYFEISSLEKGFRILELLADHEDLSVTEVADKMGMHRTGSHRFLATMREIGYVEKNGNGRYRLTFKISELSAKLRDRFEIRRVAQPYMQRLSSAYRETINLGYWTGKEVIHLDKIDSLELLRIDLPIGASAPAYCTALGKAILAFLPEEKLGEYLRSTMLRRHGPNTIISREELVEELERVRKRGYAVDNEEMAKGLRCVGSPVFDHLGNPVWALSVSGPTIRLTDEVVKRMQGDVREEAGALSAELNRRQGRKAG